MLQLFAFCLQAAVTLALRCPMPEDGQEPHLFRYPVEGETNNSVTVGFLGAYSQKPVFLGALPLAVNAVNSDPNLLPGRRLGFLAADIGSSAGIASPLSIRLMTRMRDLGTLAFIGPDGTCNAEALVAAAWNLPIISYKCADRLVSDKRIYHTFARTLPPSSKVSKSVVALLSRFRWYKFVIVYEKSPSSAQVKDAIKELATENDLIVTDEMEFKDDYIPKNIREMDTIIERTFQITRIYVFVGDHVALVDFVKCLRKRGLLEKGEYIVISADDEIYNPERRKNIIQRAYLDPWIQQEGYDIHGFRSVLKLTTSHPNNPKYKSICEKVKEISTHPPFCVPHHSTIFGSMPVPIHAAHLYDAVMIYARALTEVFATGGDPKNGTQLLRRILNRSYTSILGYDVYMDKNGDAEYNLSVVAVLDDIESNGSANGMSMQRVGYFMYPSNVTALPEFIYYNETRKIQWVGGTQPLAEPQCGFEGEKCKKDRWRIIISVGGMLCMILVATVFIFRHYRYEQKLASLLWRIDMKEVTILPTTSTRSNMIQVCRQSHLRSIMPDVSPKRAFTNIGVYKGSTVAIKAINKRSVDLTRNIRKELKQIREVRHENLISFIGASVEAGNVSILTPYCARGSLEDVLANEDLHLDNMFVSSLIADIIKGMIYLHDSDIISHGNLRSSNCLVDSRWVLQISDFGLHEFKAGQEEPDARLEQKRKLWRAPELLRAVHYHPRGTQKGDVYSFAIILYEVVGRAGPWGNLPLSPQEIIEQVKSGSCLRPDVKNLKTSPSVVKCMEDCWHEDPEQRPDFKFVRIKLKEMQAGL